MIGSKAKTITGQMEITYHNYKTVKIAIWRKMYTGQPDVNFTINDTDLPDIIETLTKPKRK